MQKELFASAKHWPIGIHEKRRSIKYGNGLYVKYVCRVHHLRVYTRCTQNMRQRERDFSGRALKPG